MAHFMADGRPCVIRDGHKRRGHRSPEAAARSRERQREYVQWYQETHRDQILDRDRRRHREYDHTAAGILARTRAAARQRG